MQWPGKVHADAQPKNFAGCPAACCAALAPPALPAAGRSAGCGGKPDAPPHGARRLAWRCQRRCGSCGLPWYRAGGAICDVGRSACWPRIVAVGERGIILLSDDNGKRWQQADVPVSVTLTAVRFADARNGVAVGHAGVVLTTSDGGAHWQRVLDGQQLAALALQAAKAAAGATRIRRRPCRDAERLVADGADKPLLDVCLLPHNRILAVGAYGLAFASEDGGRTWSWMDRIAIPKACTSTPCAPVADTILIAENAATPNSPPTPAAASAAEHSIQGSFFTAELSGDKDMLLAGLRGNAWRSSDAGKAGSSSQALPRSPSPLHHPRRRHPHTGQSGRHAARRARQALVPISTKPLPPLNAVLDLNNGGLLALSIQGMLPAAGEKP
jgi:hypothetical protein